MDIDDFMKVLESYQAKQAEENRRVRPGKKSSMSLSEVMTTVVFYYYYELILLTLKNFPFVTINGLVPIGCLKM